MYLGFYKLQEMPFRLAPDPRFMFWSAGHAAALDRIRAVQKPQEGCAIILGERGAGKTALLEYWRQHMRSHAALRIDFPPRTLSELNERIHENGESGTTNGARIILCDNAHLFHHSMLAALLRETTRPQAPEPVSCFVLAGEPELARTLETPELATLGKWRCERFHLPPLNPAEVTAYIGHRLKVAGASGGRIFSDEICAEVYRETRGNPRLINALCDAAMILACERELPVVGSAEIRRALEDVGRLVALQAEERAVSVPQAPPDDRPVTVASSAFARLRLTHREQLVLERELARGAWSIGRSPDNNLCIDSRYVSRYHCRIVTNERRCVLEDVQSMNGLYVNETRVRRHHLRDGDVVRIGEHRLHYMDLRDRAGTF